VKLAVIESIYKKNQGTWGKGGKEEERGVGGKIRKTWAAG